MKTITPIRYLIKINGIVQGVGFRPFIYKLAKEYGLAGFVKNSSEGVIIEVEGEYEIITQFINEIKLNAPPISEISNIEAHEIDYSNERDFTIIHSDNHNSNNTFISPDISICTDCLNEMFDPSNRRYLYPFINCTNCGPRFTIIQDIPYDRKFTVMKDFNLCSDCRNEYNDPADRRFHAQPNACEICGPKIWLADNNNIIDDSIENIFLKTADYLSSGKIAAVKGLGGFHLAVDASNENAVKRLRQRKNREAKPFAVMVENISDARRIAEIDREEEIILTSSQRPILLLNRTETNLIVESVAPNNNQIGIMLPYTPVHYLLFHFLKKRFSKGIPPILVMTSGNLSEEPISIDNIEARKRLADVADIFLLHNRDILIRSDDSVVSLFNSKQRIIRRSRGYVPKPVSIKMNGPNVLALGGELKNTICLAKGSKAFLSQHIGDLSNLAAYKFFKETISHIQIIMSTEAEFLIHDMHPEYLSTKYAKEQKKLPLIEVQHHHAHMASCMTENNIEDEVIGLILDGTGFGYDNTIWGGEILVGNFNELERFAHLEQMPLPGGDSASKESWKISAGYLYKSFENNAEVINLFNRDEVNIIYEMIDKKINSPLTSSTGRLFDAVAAMSGGPREIKYEAEAAVSLMHAVKKTNNMSFQYDPIVRKNNTYIIQVKKLIREVYNAVIDKVPYTQIAGRFHNSLAEMLFEAVITANEMTNINKVVLSGGVFQNNILSKLIENKLSNAGLEVYTHSLVPANDGGISLGQVSVARHLIDKNLEKVNYKY